MPGSTAIDDIDFSGQAAIVTGGASGTGRQICETFAALGADVAVVDIEEGPAEEAAAELEDDHDVDALAGTLSADGTGPFRYLPSNSGSRPSMRARNPSSWSRVS